MPLPHFVDRETANFHRTLFAKNGKGTFEIFRAGGGSGLDNADGAVFESDDCNARIFRFDIHQCRTGLGIYRFGGAHAPFQKVNVMAGLVGEDPAIQSPGAAPGVLVVIGLVSFPAYPHRTHDQLAETPRFQRCAQLEHWKIIAVLFNHEELYPGRVADPDHLVCTGQGQGHGFFHHQMFAIGRKHKGVFGVQAAFGENTHHVHIAAVGIHHGVHVGEMGNSMLGAQGLSPFRHDVADRHQPRVSHVSAAQNLGMLGRDSATAHKGKT